MITDFDDFCLWMYAIVDDIWKEIAPLFKRPGPAPICSDSELITMALVGECRGWDQETEMLSYWQEHRGLFPCIPSQSRFNRRRRNLMQAFNLIRRVVLSWLDVAQDRQCVIDSLPVPAVQFYLVPSSTGDWAAHSAVFGKVPSKKQTIFGYKLHLLITLGGVILDFELAPANVADLEVGVELLAEHTALIRASCILIPSLLGIILNRRFVVDLLKVSLKMDREDQLFFPSGKSTGILGKGLLLKDNQ